MTHRHRHRGRLGRAASAVTALAVSAAGLATISVAGAAPASAEETPVTGASFTWGISGYAQKGIFGPWNLKDFTGDASQLVGEVSNGDQHDYLVDPVPATSMPALTNPDDFQKTPNAVRFTDGTGTADAATGEMTLAWTGSYTVNAYPAQYNAPDEIYSDPQLEIAADGSGELTMDFSLGGGVDQGGDPTPPTELGRITLLEFSAGSAASTAAGAFRLTPDYQGVEVEVPGADQTRGCSTDEGATGWWGAWPQDVISNAPSAILPHFYSSGCGGMQDNKPALPVDIDLGLTSVTVSETSFLADGTYEVTVTGRNFDPALATGLYPPFKDQQSGAYVAFGRYADVWRPTEGAPGSARTNPAGPNGNGVAVKWAVPEASFAGSDPAQDPANESYTILGTDGSFTTTLKIDRSWLADAEGNYGIYTYAAGGAKVASYETFTPITFTKHAAAVKVTAAKKKFGKAGKAVVAVVSPGDVTGQVALKRGTKVVGTADVVDGRATFDLGTPAAGKHALVAAFLGNDTTEQAVGKATFTVAKAATKTTVKLTKKPKKKAKGKAKVTVKSPTTQAKGKVKVQLKKGAKVVKTITAKLNKSGIVQVKLPKATKGTGQYQIVVTYLGNANIDTSAKTVKFKVT